jgi:hypothetical protein
MKHQAIYDLYPNATSIKESDTFTAYDINGNEISIDMDAVNTKATELQTAKDNEVQAKADLKASAKTKLINGETLTEDEANVMVGL